MRSGGVCCTVIRCTVLRPYISQQIFNLVCDRFDRLVIVPTELRSSLMESPLTFELLTADNGTAFERLHRIYVEAIPERERKSKEKLQEMARHADYRFVLAMLGNEVVGFSILFAPVDESFNLLEYIAVDAAYRNAGIGARLLTHTIGLTAGTPMLVEVDSDREECSDRAVRTGRIGFYRRHGCRRIEGLEYILPLPGEGDPPVMDLLVVTAAASGSASSHPASTSVSTPSTASASTHSSDSAPTPSAISTSTSGSAPCTASDSTSSPDSAPPSPDPASTPSAISTPTSSSLSASIRTREKPRIAITELEGWLRTIYTRVYETAADDPRIVLMLRTVDDPIRIV